MMIFYHRHDGCVQLTPCLGVLVTPAFDDAGEDAATDDVDSDMAAARWYDVL